MKDEQCGSNSIVSRLFHLRRSEYNEVVYNLLLFLLVGFVYSISHIVSDTLFFSRFSVSYLPIMYILIGMTIVPVIYWYKQTLIQYYPERLLIRFTALMAAISVLLWFTIVTKKTDYVYPFFYLFNEIVSSILLIHIFHYSKYYLGEMRQQRILPIVMIGLPFGGIIGGVLMMLLAPRLGVEQFILVAGAGTGVLSLLVWRYHSDKYLYVQDPNVDMSDFFEDTFSDLQKGIIYFAYSRLFKVLVLGVLAAIIATYILNYQLADFYVKKIDSEESLVLFLAWLVAVTSSIVFFLQVFSSSRIFTPLGLRLLNLFPAFSLIISFLGLLISFTFLPAIMASIIKDLSNIVVRTSSNHPFFQAIPKSMKPRCQLVMRMLVIPFGLILTGLLLLIFQWNIVYGLLLGLMSALFYLWTNIRSNQAFYEMLFNRAQDLRFIGRTLLLRMRAGEEKILDSLLKGMDSNIHFVVMENAKRMLFWFPLLAKKNIINRIDNYQVNTKIELLQLLSNQLKTIEKVDPVLYQVNQALWRIYKTNDDTYTKCRLLYLLNQNKDVNVNQFIQHMNKKETPCKYGLHLQKLVNQYLTLSLDHNNDVSQLYHYIVVRLSDMLANKDLAILSEALLIATNTPQLHLPIQSLLPVLLSTEENHRYSTLLLLEKRKHLASSHIASFYSLVNDQSHRVQLKMIHVANNVQDAASCQFFFDVLTLSHRSEIREEALKYWLLNGGKFSFLYEYIIHNKGAYSVNNTIMKYGRGLFTHRELLSLIDNRFYVAMELLDIIHLQTLNSTNNKDIKILAIDDGCSTQRLVDIYSRYAHQYIHGELDHLPVIEQFTIIVLQERLRQLLLQILYALCHIDDQAIIHNVLSIVRASQAQHFNQLSAMLLLIRNQQYYKRLTRLVYAVTKPNNTRLDRSNHMVEQYQLKLEKWCLYSADPWVKCLVCLRLEDDMLDLVDRIILLKKMDIFNEIYTEDLKLMAEALEEDYLMSGDFVFKKGDPSDSCYLISEGKIGMSVDFKIDAKSPLVTLKAGGYFGEMGVLDGHPRAVTAYVIDDVRLLRISRERFLSIIQHHPEIAISIISRMNSIIREQNQQLYNNE